MGAGRQGEQQRLRAPARGVGHGLVLPLRDLGGQGDHLVAVAVHGHLRVPQPGGLELYAAAFVERVHPVHLQAQLGRQHRLLALPFFRVVGIVVEGNGVQGVLRDRHPKGHVVAVGGPEHPRGVKAPRVVREGGDFFLPLRRSDVPQGCLKREDQILAVVDGIRVARRHRGVIPEDPLADEGSAALRRAQDQGAKQEAAAVVRQGHGVLARAQFELQRFSQTARGVRRQDGFPAAPGQAQRQVPGFIERAGPVHRQRQADGGDIPRRMRLQPQLKNRVRGHIESEGDAVPLADPQRALCVFLFPVLVEEVPGIVHGLLVSHHGIPVQVLDVLLRREGDVFAAVAPERVAGGDPGIIRPDPLLVRRLVRIRKSSRRHTQQRRQQEHISQNSFSFVHALTLLSKAGNKNMLLFV